MNDCLTTRNGTAGPFFRLPRQHAEQGANNEATRPAHNSLMPACIAHRPYSRSRSPAPGSNRLSFCSGGWGSRWPKSPVACSHQGAHMPDFDLHCSFPPGRNRWEGWQQDGTALGASHALETLCKFYQCSVLSLSALCSSQLAAISPAGRSLCLCFRPARPGSPAGLDGRVCDCAACSRLPARGSGSAGAGAPSATACWRAGAAAAAHPAAAHAAVCRAGDAANVGRQHHAAATAGRRASAAPNSARAAASSAHAR